jgi:hypothetical protein
MWRKGLSSEMRFIAGSLRIEPFEGRRRGCGGRGQFGKAPLWDLNTIPDFRREFGNADHC